MDKIGALFLILLTVLLTVYGQLVLKWQVNAAGAPSSDWMGRIEYVGRMLLNPWVLSGLMAGFLAMLSWMIALTKVELSYAYPFTSLSFVLVLIASALVFREAVTLPKLAGMALIVAGIWIGSR